MCKILLMPDYMIPVSTSFYEQEIKRSRFLVWIHHSETPDAAKEIIKKTKIQYPDAQHVCWAWVAGSPDSQYLAMSDDGEPSGTAGKPMLNVLQHQKIGEVTAVAVRYFGGIKLGTGGLSRAYSSSVTKALKITPLKRKINITPLLLSFSYQNENIVRHLLTTAEVTIDTVEYQEDIRFQCSVPTNQYDSLKQQLPFTVTCKVLD